MIKVGVIGVGEMGQHHARLYSQLDCELVGVVDTAPRKAKEIGEKKGVIQVLQIVESECQIMIE